MAHCDAPRRSRESGGGVACTYRACVARWSSWGGETRHSSGSSGSSGWWLVVRTGFMVGRNAGLRYPKHVYSKNGKTFCASVFIGFRQEFGPKRNSIAEAQADLPPMLERQRWAIAQRKQLGFLARPSRATQPASEASLTALEARARQQQDRDLRNAHFLRTNGGRLPKYVYKQRSKFRATVCIHGRTASAPGRDTILEAQSDVLTLLWEQKAQAARGTKPCPKKSQTVCV